MMQRLPNGQAPKEKLKNFRKQFVALTTFLLMGAGVAAPAQSEAQKFNLNIKDASLNQLFQKIEEQSDYSFVYNVAEIESVGRKDYQFFNANVSTILSRAMAGTFLAYEIKDKHVIITKSMAQQVSQGIQVRGTVTDPSGGPLAGVVIRVKGTNVGTTTDVEGNYMLSFTSSDPESVVLVFSYIGMTTQEIPLQKRAIINVKMTISVIVIDDVIVIQTGYQTIDRRKSTSAVETLRSENFLVPGIQSVDLMLEGHVSGMTFMQNSGTIGATPRIRIRGTSTVLGNQEPLWVVDGIVQTDPIPFDPMQLNDLDYVNLLGNSISGINPEDIEQIDILKDASATAIYGVRAANGVIVITTKKGKPGPPRVSYSFSGTFSRRPHYTDRSVNMMNSRERVDFSRELMDKNLPYGSINSWVGYEGAMYDYMNGKIDFTEFKRLVAYYETLNTDWFSILTQNSFTQKHDISVSGGTGDIRYYASAGCADAQGVVKNERNKTYTANINMSANVKKLTASFGANMSFQDRKYNPSDLGGAGMGVLNYAYGTNRAIPAYDENGDPYFYNVYYHRDDNNAMRTPFNIMNDMENSYSASEVYSTSLTASLNWRATRDFGIGATLSYKYGTTLQELYYGPDTYHARTLRGEGVIAIGGAQPYNYMPVGGELTESGTYNRAYVARIQASYNRHIDSSGKHYVSATGGFEVSSSRYETRKQMYRGYIERDQSVHYLDPSKIENDGYYNWYYSNTIARGQHFRDLTNLVSGYATVSYDFCDRYILNANARIDASNQFGSRSRERLLPIWSFSGRWNIKKDLLSGIPWVNSLALKASLGLQGNMLTTESSELIMQYSGKVNAENEFLSYISSFPNLDLDWEKTTSTNVSLEFSLFGNSVNGSLSYWHKYTRDAFLSKSISTVNGRDRYTVNSGNIMNHGLELGLSFVAINHVSESNPEGFRWTIVPNFGETINQLLSRKNNTIKDEYTFKDYLNGTVEIVGRPLNSFYSYKFTGLDSADGRPMFYGIDKDEFLPVYASLGVDNMDRIFMTVMEYSGRRVPIVQGGLSNNISFKRFQVSFNMAFSFGSKVRLLKMYPDVDRLYNTIAPQPDKNVRREFVNRWRGTGDEKYTNIPGVLTGDEFVRTTSATSIWWKQSGTQFPFADNIWQMYDYSDLRVVSGDYIRMQSFSVRYNLPERMSHKIFLKSAYVAFSGTNIFTICSKKLNGQDPTTQSGSSTTINQSNRPAYTFSFNVTF